MSHADNSYDPKEMAAIKDKMKQLFPPDTDLEKKLYGTIREYNDFDKGRLGELIEDTFNHFSHDAHLTPDVYKDLSEIIQADGKVNASEQQVLDSMKQLIAIHARDIK